MMRRAMLLSLGLLFVAPAFAVPERLPIEDFLRHAHFEMIKISPEGDYLAASYRDGDQIKLRILDRKTLEPQSSFEFGDNHRVWEFHWVDVDRLLMIESKFVGYLDTKGDVARMFVTDVDGRNQLYLGRSDLASAGYAGESFEFIDVLKDDPDNIIVGQFNPSGVRPFRMNIRSGKKQFMGSPRMAAPDSFSAGIGVDNDGELRFIVEAAKDFKFYTHVRDPESDEWRMLELGASDGRADIYPVAFYQDNDRVMLFSNHDASTLGLFDYDLETGEIELLFRDPEVDLDTMIVARDKTILGFQYMPGKPDTLWLEPEHPDAKARIGLMKAFPGQEVRFTSHTTDNKESVVFVSSDTNPGEFYIYDWESNQLKFLLSRMPWITPEQMATVTPIRITARDGTPLRGYVTLPQGSDGKDLPMVVNVHGGPHGPRDEWGFSYENQLLANRGYAVLQINFRGSGGYGREFLESGYRNWGGTMQDDVTDATLWAIDQGIADKNRICIYGGSYGGYAALQGVVREPDLYQCAIGYVGVYDLNKWGPGCGDTARFKRGRDYLKLVIGDDEEDKAMRSPASNAKKIKAAVFLAHGEDDERVPMCQGLAMKKALERIGKDFIWMQKNEGHGYQKLENRIDFYGTMEEFLAEHIGS